MRMFLEDYEIGRAERRYIDAELPALPFPDASIDLAPGWSIRARRDRSAAAQPRSFAWNRDLKRACGVGGTVTDDGVALQGDVREKIRELLSARGFLVKG
jgi:hypothetical protein